MIKASNLLKFLGVIENVDVSHSSTNKENFNIAKIEASKLNNSLSDQSLLTYEKPPQT